MKKIIVGGVIAGLIVFIWGMISWMVLPFHMNNMNKFKSELVVEKMLSANAPEKGMYVLPYADPKDKEQSKEAHAKHNKGPSALVIFNPGAALLPFPFCMITGLLIQILGGCLMTWLLLQTSIETFIRKLAFVKVIAFFAAVVAVLPNFIYWQFPAGYTILMLLDLMIGWSLAGMWLAKFTRKQA